MAVDAVGNQYKNSGTLTGQMANKTDMDKETFLKLLVTQFQYQDPLNPMEDKEFVAQLAQFTSLEQLMSVNDGLSTITQLQQQSQTLSAANYIGKEVTARGYGISKTGENISTLKYAMDEQMIKGYANILDANRQVVSTISLGSKAPGVHNFDEWDGTFSNGQPAPDGVYTIAISGTNADGKTIMVDCQVSGRVVAVSSYEGQQYLKLSDERVVALSEVSEVVEAKVLKPEVPKDPDVPVDPEDPDDPADPGYTEDPDNSEDQTDPEDPGTGTT